MSSTPDETPNAGAALTATASPAPPPPHLERMQTDPNLRNCFICLQTSAETPKAVWVNACPCTLEAHEDCMLRWISEHERESTKSLRCPACKGKIKTTEPRDGFISLRDRLHKVYSRMTPAILLGVLTGCSMAGSSYYGFWSMLFFAGPVPTENWLGAYRALAERREHPGVPFYRWKSAWDFCFRFWLLNFIAPTLLIQKALPPQLIDIMTVPLSLLYGASLVLRNDMPTWPPSPAWVMTMLPWVSFSYNRIYHDLFGAYERRLNIALRGRGPPTEDVLAVEGGNNEGGQQVDVVADNGAAEQEDEEGYLAQAMRVGNAVLNMLGDDNNDEEVVAEIELQIGRADDEQAAIEELHEELDEVASADGDDGAVVPEEGQNEEAREQANQQNGENAGDAAAPAPVIHLEAQADNQPAAAAAPNNGNNMAPEEPIREARGTSTTLTDLVNGVVSALSIPIVCWGAGEVLRVTLPPSWVMRPSARAATGLLQEQWGRSLVGGAVFIVARDMVNLYTKHRRVEVRKHRKVRNVPRRKAQR